MGGRMVLMIFGLVGALLYGAAFAHTAWTAMSAQTDHPGEGLVVVLGAGLRDGKTTETFEARLTRGAQLVGAGRRGIISGGDTGGGASEAQAGLSWLIQSGLAQDWTLEDQSRSTRENIRFSSSLVNEQFVLLVSSRTHLARSRDLAKRAGWKVEVVAAEDRLDWSWHTLRTLLWETTCRFGELVVR